MCLQLLTNREDKQNVNSQNALSVRMVLTYQASQHVCSSMFQSGQPHCWAQLRGDQSPLPNPIVVLQGRALHGQTGGGTRLDAVLSFILGLDHFTVRYSIAQIVTLGYFWTNMDQLEGALEERTQCRQHAMLKTCNTHSASCCYWKLVVTRKYHQNGMHYTYILFYTTMLSKNVNNGHDMSWLWGEWCWWILMMVIVIMLGMVVVLVLMPDTCLFRVMPWPVPSTTVGMASALEIKFRRLGMAWAGYRISLDTWT